MATVPSPPLPHGNLVLWRGEVLLSGLADSITAAPLRLRVVVVPGSIDEDVAPAAAAAAPATASAPAAAAAPSKRRVALVGCTVALKASSPPPTPTAATPTAAPVVPAPAPASDDPGADAATLVLGARGLSRVITLRPCGEPALRRAFHMAVRCASALAPALAGVVLAQLPAPTATERAAWRAVALHASSNKQRLVLALRRVDVLGPIALDGGSDLIAAAVAADPGRRVDGLEPRRLRARQRLQRHQAGAAAAVAAAAAAAAAPTASATFATKAVSGALRLAAGRRAAAAAASTAAAAERSAWVSYVATAASGPASGGAVAGAGVAGVSSGADDAGGLFFKLRESSLIGPGPESSCQRVVGLRQMFRLSVAKTQAWFTVGLSFKPLSAAAAAAAASAAAVAVEVVRAVLAAPRAGALLGKAELASGLAQLRRYVKGGWPEHAVACVVVAQSAVRAWIAARRRRGIGLMLLPPAGEADEGAEGASGAAEGASSSEESASGASAGADDVGGAVGASGTDASSDANGGAGAAPEPPAALSIAIAPAKAMSRADRVTAARLVAQGAPLPRVVEASTPTASVEEAAAAAEPEAEEGAAEPPASVIAPSVPPPPASGEDTPLAATLTI